MPVKALQIGTGVYILNYSTIAKRQWIEGKEAPVFEDEDKALIATKNVATGFTFYHPINEQGHCVLVALTRAEIIQMNNALLDIEDEKTEPFDGSDW